MAKIRRSEDYLCRSAYRLKADIGESFSSDANNAVYRYTPWAARKALTKSRQRPSGAPAGMGK
jgi:hypothetical protein